MPIRINTQTIDDSVIRDELRELREECESTMGHMSAVERELHLSDLARERVIERELLRQAAESEVGLEGDDIDERVEALVDRVTAHTVPPTIDECAAYYAANRERLWNPEMVRASHILAPVSIARRRQEAFREIAAIAARIDDGEPFAPLATELGWFARGEMLAEFEAVVFELSPGQRSGIFQTPLGFHIALLEERRAEGIPEFDDALADIEVALFDRKRRVALEAYIEGLRRAAHVRLVP